MERFKSITIILLLAFAVLVSAAQTKPASVLLQEGLYAEEVKGDLDAAIQVYERILKDFPRDRPVAAKALLHIGFCKEKLGLNEAINAYQKVVDQYPEQQGQVAIAKDRIAKLSKVLEKVAHQPTFRKIRIPTTPGNGALSPDGKKLAFASGGSIWVVPVHGKVSPDIAGEPVRLPGTEGAWRWGISWSANGKWIAYNNLKNDEICIVPSSGGKTKRISVKKRDGMWNYRLSLSPDGKIVAFAAKEKEKIQLFTVNVDGGDVNQLTEDGGTQPAFSPDGKKIAYVKTKPQRTEIPKTDVWVIPAAGGTPVQVSDLPGRATGPIWSPDGKMIGFTRKGGDDASKEICIVPVSETGNPQASPTQIELPLTTWDFLAGWTPDDKIGVLLTEPHHQAIYTVPASGGNATQVTPKGYTFHPKWSPDGERIYFRWNGGDIASVPSKGGEISTVPLDADSKIFVALPGAGNAVCPDGKKIVFSGAKMVFRDNKKAYEVDIYTIPIEGGEPKKLAISPGQDRYPCWAPDGKSIAFIRYPENPEKKNYIMNICIVSTEGGEVRQLTSESHRVLWSTIAWSPDGKSIAYFSDDKAIKVIPVQGGEPRVVVKVEKVSSHSELAWSPDGSKLVYSSKGSISVVSSDGGEPEEIETGLDAKAGHVSWSPDAKKLAFTAIKGGDAELWLMENFLPGDKDKKVARKATFRKIEIASKPQNGVLSPDGNQLAFISDGAVWVVPLHGKVNPDIAGEPVRLAEVPAIWDSGSLMAWSADGEWIAVNAWPDEDEVHVLPVPGGEPRVVQMPKRGSHSWSYRLSLSPDGQMLAFSALELRKPRQKTSDPHDRYICTIATAGGEPKQVSSGWGRMPSFSPDGETIAYVDSVRKNWQETERYLLGGELWIVPSEGGTPVRLASVEGRLRGPVWSPDGKYIAAHHEPGGTNDSKEIWVFPLSPDASSAGEPEKIALPHSSMNMLAGWTPDGELGVFIQSEQHWAMYTVPARGGKAVQVAPEGLGYYYPRWSPDAERIFFRWIRRGEKPFVRMGYVAADGGAVVDIPWPGRPFVSCVPGGGHNVSPDGKRIVISASHDIWTIPLEGGLPTRLTNDDSHEEYPCWSPDGEWVAFVDEVDYAIYIIPAEGGQIRQVTSKSDSVGGGAIAFSPDGKRIAFFSDRSIKTIPVEGGETEVLVGEVKSGRHSQLAYSPDGSKIAHNAGGKIWITSLGGAEPEELRTGLPEDAELGEFGWSPDGTKIVFIATIGGESEFWLIGNFLPELNDRQ